MVVKKVVELVEDVKIIQEVDILRTMVVGKELGESFNLLTTTVFTSSTPSTDPRSFEVNTVDAVKTVELLKLSELV